MNQSENKSSRQTTRSDRSHNGLMDAIHVTLEICVTVAYAAFMLSDSLPYRAGNPDSRRAPGMPALEGLALEDSGREADGFTGAPTRGNSVTIRNGWFSEGAWPAAGSYAGRRTQRQRNQTDILHDLLSPSADTNHAPVPHPGQGWTIFLSSACSSRGKHPDRAAVQ